MWRPLPRAEHACRFASLRPSTSRALATCHSTALLATAILAMNHSLETMMPSLRKGVHIRSGPCLSALLCSPSLVARMFE